MRHAKDQYVPTLHAIDDHVVANWKAPRANAKVVIAGLAQVGCPALVPTVWVSATQLTAAIPADLAGDQGAVITISVYVQNADLSISALLPTRSI